MTIYHKVDRFQPDLALLQEAADILRQGGLVAFPTETVYGLGANALDSEAAAAVYRAKGRPSDNPLIVHIADTEAVEQVARNIPESAWLLMRTYWPGPLTLVLWRQPCVPDRVTGGLDTVAVRLPDSQVTRALIRLAGVPMVGPSANTSGRPSPTTAEAVLGDLDGKIQYILDAGPCDIGLESTIVDCTTAVPTVLRPGGITVEMLRDTLGTVEAEDSVEEKETAPKAPGMKYRHYAPNAPMILVECRKEWKEEAITAYLCDAVKKALGEGKKVGVLASAETLAHMPPEMIGVALGSRNDRKAWAVNLYQALRSFDSQPVDLIYAEGMSEEGIGLAVMNRLRKAAGYQIVQI